jgi:AcrR family transcriptional regulator
MARQTTTRDRLIATASELFWRQGYAQTGVNEIISQAQATSGSFYHFFATKEDLLLAVVDHVGEQFRSEIFGGGAATTVADVLERVHHSASRHEPVLGSPLGTLAAELAATHPRVRERIAAHFQSWRQEIEAVLARESHTLTERADRSALATTILSLIEGGLLQARVSQNLAAFEASAGHLLTSLRMLETGDSVRSAAAPTTLSTPTQQPVDWRSW